MGIENQVLILKALSDKTRLNIVKMLSTENLCACQLLEEFSLSQATLSYHMKQLQDSGLVSGRKDRYWTRYFLNKDILLPLVHMVDAFVEDVKVVSPPIQCRRSNDIKPKFNS